MLLPKIPLMDYVGRPILGAIFIALLLLALGMALLGRVRAERSGHLLHAALMSSLLRNRAAWEIVNLPASSEARTFVSA